MDRNRLLELAVKELERQRAAVDAEIGTIRAELRVAGATRMERPVTTGITARRRKTPAERKAQSEKMRKIWAARREKAAEAKKPDLPKLKVKRAAVNKAISAAMKTAWAKRKAKAAGKAAKPKPASSKASSKPSEA